jgi:hypothetical protein
VSVAFIPSAPADLELIAQLRSKLQYAELQIRVQEERLRLMRIEKYGACGEKLSQAQMQLFELAPVVSEMIEKAETDHAPVRRPTKGSGKHPGRQELPANLPRVERVLPCKPDQRVCTRCGRETVVIGYEESSQLNVPAKYFVLVTKREKRACRLCEVFDFRLGRGRDGPKRFLGQFEGILQTDGYAAYDQIGGPRMVHAACWSHARRQFFEAVQLNPRDPVATPIVARMDELFSVDADARRGALSVAARHIRRQETARPLLDDIRRKIEAAQSFALPSSALSKACQYALGLWKCVR